MVKALSTRTLHKALPQGLGSPVLALIKPYTSMRDCFRWLALINVVLLPIAMLVHGEAYRFFAFPLSDLGAVRTRNGYPNYTSMALFALNMLACAFVVARYSRSNRAVSVVPYRIPKHALAATAAVGFVIGITPHDLVHPLHTAGCSLMVGSLWFLGNLFSVELWRMDRRRAVAATQAVLQLTVLPYAAAFFAGWDVKQVLQKFAIAGLFVSLRLATRWLRESVVVKATRLTGWAAEANPRGERTPA